MGSEVFFFFFMSIHNRVKSISVHYFFFFFSQVTFSVTPPDLGDFLCCHKQTILTFQQFQGQRGSEVCRPVLPLICPKVQRCKHLREGSLRVVHEPFLGTSDSKKKVNDQMINASSPCSVTLFTSQLTHRVAT